MSSLPADGSLPHVSKTSRRAQRSHSRLVKHARRLLVACSVVVIAAAIFAALPGHALATTGYVGQKGYYLGLGDSLAFGYEPNSDWSHGYVQQWSSELKTHKSTSLTNYGCNGEKTSTFINGGCPYWYVLHNYYFGSQLNAALSFIKNHAGNVSPVSLDMGANDVLPDIDTGTCTVNTTNWNNDLATMNANLTNTILPKLIAALTSNGKLTGDLVMMNYYNPFAAKCPGDTQYITTLNADLVNDWNTAWGKSSIGAAPHGLVDVYSAFGGTTGQAANDCTYTWMCSTYADIHATGGQSGEPGNGYGAIAKAFEQTTGY